MTPRMIYALSLSFDDLAKMLEVDPVGFDSDNLVVFFDEDGPAIAHFLTTIYGPAVNEWDDAKVQVMFQAVRDVLRSDAPAIQGSNFVAPDIKVVLSALPLAA